MVNVGGEFVVGALVGIVVWGLGFEVAYRVWRWRESRRSCPDCGGDLVELSLDDFCDGCRAKVEGRLGVGPKERMSA